MKKTIIIAVGALCLSVTAIQAQDVAPQPPTDTVQQAEPSESYLKEMIKIQPSEVPTQLRSTLESPKFTGWEEAVIYRSKNSDFFVLQLRDKTYQFDEKGKLIKENE